MVRLKRHKAGARLILRDQDLLIACVLPRSKYVHLGTFIVTLQGEIEFAEWRVGAEPHYAHREGQLELDGINDLANTLAHLGQSF